MTLRPAQVRSFDEGRGQIMHCRVILEEALVGEAQVDLRLDRAWIQGKNLLELFGGAEKIALSESCPDPRKRCFDVLL